MCVDGAALTSLFGYPICSHQLGVSPYTLWAIFAEEPYVRLVKCSTGVLQFYLNVVWPPYLISTGFWSRIAKCVIVYCCKITESCPPPLLPKCVICYPWKITTIMLRKANSALAYWHCNVNVLLVITEANMTFPYTITIPYLWLKPGLWSILMNSSGLRSLKANWGCAGVFIIFFFWTRWRCKGYIFGALSVKCLLIEFGYLFIIQEVQSSAILFGNRIAAWLGL